MPDAPKAATPLIEDALRSAMVQAWDDFATVAIPRVIRVEYLGEPGVPVDQLTVWLVSAGGYQERICDYRAGLPSDGQGWRCWTRLHSTKLVGALDFIMRHQERFRRIADANPHGLIVVFPPTEEQRAEATAWAAEIGIIGWPLAAPRARVASVAQSL
jgi:hypothetical protein